MISAFGVDHGPVSKGLSDSPTFKATVWNKDTIGGPHAKSNRKILRRATVKPMLGGLAAGMAGGAALGGHAAGGAGALLGGAAGGLLGEVAGGVHGSKKGQRNPDYVAKMAGEENLGWLGENARKARRTRKGVHIVTDAPRYTQPQRRKAKQIAGGTVATGGLGALTVHHLREREQVEDAIAKAAFGELVKPAKEMLGGFKHGVGGGSFGSSGGGTAGSIGAKLGNDTAKAGKYVKGNLKPIGVGAGVGAGAIGGAALINKPPQQRYGPGW